MKVLCRQVGCRTYPMKIIVISFGLLFSLGCNNDYTPREFTQKDYEQINNLLVENITELLSCGIWPEDVVVRSKYVYSLWLNNTLDVKPVVTCAFFGRSDPSDMNSKVSMHLYLYDEDKDIRGVILKEEHSDLNEFANKEEKFPIYDDGESLLTYTHSLVELKIYNKDLKSNTNKEGEEEWEIPSVYISETCLENDQLYMQVYDGKGNRSDIIKVYNYIGKESELVNRSKQVREK